MGRSAPSSGRLVLPQLVAGKGKDEREKDEEREGLDAFILLLASMGALGATMQGARERSRSEGGARDPRCRFPAASVEGRGKPSFSSSRTSLPLKTSARARVACDSAGSSAELELAREQRSHNFSPSLSSLAFSFFLFFRLFLSLSFSLSRRRSRRPQALPGAEERRAERPGRELARRDRDVLRQSLGEARAQVRSVGVVVRFVCQRKRRRGPPLVVAVQVALGSADLLGPQPDALPSHPPGGERRCRNAHPRLLAGDGPMVLRQGRLVRF